MESPGFSKFRSLMDLWDDYLVEEEESNKINSFIDANDMVFFFKKGDSYFGASEDSRVVFARLKNPDDDTPEGWEDEATFTAVNLSKFVKGEPAQHVFNGRDISNIKVVDREKMVEALNGQKGDSEIPFGKLSAAVRIIRISRGLPNSDRDEAPNFSRADEE